MECHPVFSEPPFRWWGPPGGRSRWGCPGSDRSPWAEDRSYRSSPLSVINAAPPTDLLQTHPPLSSVATRLRDLLTAGLYQNRTGGPLNIAWGWPGKSCHVVRTVDASTIDWDSRYLASTIIQTAPALGTTVLGFSNRSPPNLLRQQKLLSWKHIGNVCDVTRMLSAVQRQWC